ncbi:enolase C-terminal domain-like protein [Nonomuraea insulae]|uniref:Enolase C-terminal domain-like protein n=1 Tax=Nonomuraea insulae TaxID=1616787 RepID=A0ABW1CIE5_9ACTN
MLKVGADLDEDIRRVRLAREAVGPDVRIAMDANQAWNVGQPTRR